MSSQAQGISVDIAAVNGAPAGDSGIAHAAELVAFTEAVMGADPTAVSRSRESLRRVLSDAAYVDACATIAAFNVVDRIADATGIPLDDGLGEISRDLRKELRLDRFASAANTPD